VHLASMQEMKRQLCLILDTQTPLRILDVGSRQCLKQSTYRELMLPNWEYLGCDIQTGPNVDFVQLGSYKIQTTANDYDAVISGQCLEHVEYPWLLIQEMTRVCKIGGFLFLVAPWRFQVHKFPIDCWRFLPDGMLGLARLFKLQVIASYILANDTWLIAKKVVELEHEPVPPL